ncbi:MAG: hypothetical protein ACI89L_001120 [Phycisphaerales bacterium]|jgi:hypothetical protein
MLFPSIEIASEDRRDERRGDTRVAQYQESGVIDLIIESQPGP